MLSGQSQRVPGVTSLDEEVSMPRTFAVTFDYLCPFARNAFESIAAGLADGRDWRVQYVPFSLSQARVP